MSANWKLVVEQGPVISILLALSSLPAATGSPVAAFAATAAAAAAASVTARALEACGSTAAGSGY